MKTKNGLALILLLSELGKKKIHFSLFLLCILSLDLHAVTSPPSSVNKQMTVTVGVPFEIDPYSDCGITPSMSLEPMITKNDKTVHGENAYIITPEGEISVSATQHDGHYSYSTRYHYWTYTLTPLVSGIHYFDHRCHWVIGTYGQGGTSGFSSIKYTFNVVELTGVNIPSSLSLGINETYSFTPTYVPAGATSNPTWTSSNESVATISEEGNLTTCGFGETTITCTTHNGLSTECVVTVSNGLALNNAIGCKGANTTMTVNMSNTEPITAFQFEVVLPEGISMTGCTLSERKADQTVSYSKLANGNYQVTSLSATNSAFSGNEGVLVSMRLSIEDNVTQTDYPVQLKEIELTTATKAINPSNVTATLTVTNVLLGDTDGNSKVSIFDAVQVVNHILGNNPTGFVEAAADLDGNGKITIFDAVSIVNIILNQTD